LGVLEKSIGRGIRKTGDFRKIGRFGIPGIFGKSGSFGESASDRGSAGAATKNFVRIGDRPAKRKIFAEIATLPERFNYFQFRASLNLS
jgi:hypothetical protein